MLAIMIFCVTFRVILAGDLPSYFPRCHVDDPKLNECILNATETVRPYLRKGVPELGIPSFSPLTIPSISLQQGTDAVNYKVNLSNVTIRGLDNYAFTEFGYNPKTISFEGLAAFKSLSLTANYDIEGKILAIPIKGHGTYTGVLGPSTGALKIASELVKRNGVDYIQPNSVKATIAISSVEGTFDGLFNSNEELTRVTNQALNDNSEDILKEVIPAVERVAEQIVNQVMLGITKNIPYHKLLPPSH